MPTRTATICNKKGLHARAAAKFVKCAAQFEAQVRVRRFNPPEQADLTDSLDETVCARSILGLMMLGAHSGIELELAADGPDAQAAIDTIAALIENRFEENE